jgi:hypothetical protein
MPTTRVIAVGHLTFVIAEQPELAPVRALQASSASECHHRDRPEFDRTGFILYPDSAVLLSEHLLRTLGSKQHPGGKRALELGAGSVGLPGLCLVHMHWNVTFTDVAEMLDALRINVERNTPQDHGEVRVCELVWGSNIAAAIGEQGFDLVVASDVVYQDKHVEPLVATLRLTCKRDAYVCCEERLEGLLDRFELAAKTNGFSVKRLSGDDYLRLYHLRRRG